MGLIQKLFGKSEHPAEHSVIVHFQYHKDDLEALHLLEDALEELLTVKKVGEYDGHEIAADYSDGFLYLYGQNAETLFKAIKPVLEATDFMKGSVATLRFGEPGTGAHEIEVEL
jgi:hypothetical protein